MTDFYQWIRVPLALLLAATLLCSFSGCGFFYNENEISEILEATDPEQTQDPAKESESPFSLSYYTEEVLNPFTSSSRTNTELLRLCYSGLFSVDCTYGAVPVMAESYEVDGNTVRVRLRPGIRFSDGTPVTAADCVASFARAAKKDSVWRTYFSYIRSYTAQDESTFQVVFRSYYPTQLNLLSIPIVKSGTESAETPTGCGRYRFSSDGGFELVRADCGILEGEYALDTVSLLGIADREALIYNFNYGRLQAVCADLSLGADEYRSDSELITVPTNRITFLVVNKARKEFANVNFSKGLTYLLDRKELVAKACSSFATPVWYPLNPAWSVTVDSGLNPDIYSVATAGEAFSAAGFSLEGGQRLYGGKPVTLRVLVNRENSGRVKAAEYLVTALQEAGFTVELVQATWDEYQTAVKTMNFDLYLGEVHLPSNLDLSSLYTAEICNTGEPAGTYEALRQTGAGVLSGTVDVQTYVSEFQNALPFIPLYYSLDALAVSMEVVGEFGASTELYWGMEHWSVSDAE